MPASEQMLLVDGSVDFSGGVDSLRVPTLQSPANPNGLPRNMLAWLVNATTRGGGITQRTGWQPKGTIFDSTGLFQGGCMYDPSTALPYAILSISGHIWQVYPDFAIAPIDLSLNFGLFNPATEPQAFFVQAEGFLIIQAGDNLTLPLFWDGTTLRRSNGLTGNVTYPNINEIPAATAMDYYMGRLWYVQGRQYSAGDIVGNTASGTLAYRFTDSVLKVTENPLAIGGDGFTVPTQAGNIRALKHSANLDAALGQGTLFIGTPKAIYALQVPVTRADWIAATANKQPLQTVVQQVNGFVGDRSVVPINGDLFYQTLQPSVSSLITALRYFAQWGNTPISSNEQRILQFADRALLHLSTGIQFDNRILQSTLPRQTPQGVVHTALMPMDFTPLSSFQNQLPPVWEGHHEGLQIMQLLEASFGGLDRAFAIILSEADSSIQLWEITKDQRFENGDNRVTWQIEFPAFNWGQEFDMKKLVSAELWIDKVFGKVDFTMEYRPDADPCWKRWHVWQLCTARNSCENVIEPACYPIDQYRESFRATMTLPRPPESCETVTGRPAFIAYQIQPRLTIKGWCRIRGLLLHAEKVKRQLYAGIVC